MEVDLNKNYFMQTLWLAWQMLTPWRAFPDRDKQDWFEFSVNTIFCVLIMLGFWLAPIIILMMRVNYEKRKQQ